eukprot:6032212-Pleurochrysis_carterae.AAC.1
MEAGARMNGGDCGERSHAIASAGDEQIRWPEMRVNAHASARERACIGNAKLATAAAGAATARLARAPHVGACGGGGEACGGGEEACGGRDGARRTRRTGAAAASSPNPHCAPTHTAA